MSEITNRAEEIRATAAKVSTVQELAALMRSGGRPWPIGSASAANDQLKLGLKYVRPHAKTGPREKRTCPKPVKKGGKADD